MPIGLIIAIIIAAGAGVTLTASNDVPGDALYNVKVEVNEELADAVALSAHTQARTDADIALRRVSEAEELAARGELSAEVAAQLEERFEARVDAFESHIAELRERGDFEAAAEATAGFEAALEAHEEVLERLKERTDRINSLLERVRARVEMVEKVRAEVEARVTSQLSPNVEAAALGRLRAAENKIKEVENFLDRRGDRLAAEVRADAEAQLEAAARLVAEGEAELNEDNFGEAFVLFQRAHGAAQQAQLTAIASLNLQVHIDLDDEDEEDEEEEDEDRDDDEDEDEDDEDDEADIEIEGEGEVNIDL